MYQMNLTKFIKLSLHSDVTWPATLRLEVSLHETTSGQIKTITQECVIEKHIKLYLIILCYAHGTTYCKVPNTNFNAGLFLNELIT